MRFRNLRAKGFRNLSSVDIKFSPSLNIFIGENGQGKTNCLEALYILARGDSFRYGDNLTFVGFTQDQAYIESIIAKDNGLENTLQTLIQSQSKHFQMDKKRIASSSLAKLFSVVLFSPESLAAIKEGSDNRRELIDDLIISIDPKAADLISSFKKCHRARNKILKNFVDKKCDRSTTIDLLESINSTFFKLSTELTTRRTSAIISILPNLNKAMSEITGKNVEISVEYVISEQNALQFTSHEVDKLLRERAKQLFDAELGSGVSLIGPQKHDVRFLYNQKDSRFFCSQGQQRALILAFKMAQIVYHSTVHGNYPILMLDDVLSELDAEKRDLLIRFLAKTPTQIFITTTDFNLPESFEGNEIAVFTVIEGRVSTLS